MSTLLLVLFLLVALWQGAAPSMARSDEPTASTVPRTLIQNAGLLITMDPQLGEGPLGTLANADLLFAGDSIVAVGKGLSAADETVIDATGAIVLPGFVDFHTPLVQSVIRGGCSDQDLLGWLKDCIWPAYRALTSEDVYAAARLSTLDLIGTGVTTVVNWASGLNFDVAPEYVRALRESGLRFIYAPTPRKDERHLLKRLYEELIRPNPLATLQLSGTTGMQNLPSLMEAAQLARE